MSWHFFEEWSRLIHRFLLLQLGFRSVRKNNNILVGNGNYCFEMVVVFMKDRRVKIVISIMGVAIIVLLVIFLNTKNQNIELAQTVQQQTTIIEELRNGAERRIVEIRSLFKNKQFKELYTAANELSKCHPESKESIEAQGYVDQAKNEEAIVLAQKKAEEQKQKALAEQSQGDKARAVMLVSRVSTDNPNSANGVNFRVIWQNTSDKVIKYCRFTVVPYNAVGDIVSCFIRHESEYTGQVTGPINPGQWYGEDKYWSCAWYNNTITHAKLKKVAIDYMDGTSTQLVGKDVEYIQM